MELIKVGERTYYIKNNTNIGVYKVNDEEVYLIDTGNDKDAGKKILKIIEEQGWKVKGIINTHSNADHVGGNKVIQERTNCEILNYGIEKCITENPILEPSFLYGGFPLNELLNKALYAKATKSESIEENLPEGLEILKLNGHFFEMIGIKTPDNVYFIADSVFSEETISKYHLFFMYDVKAFLETLEYLKGLEGFFVPSHSEATNNLTQLIELNENKVREILEKIFNLCKEEKTFEQILKSVFDDYELNMSLNQYFLVGSTVKSYLSYLANEGRITFEFKDNQMFWKQKCIE